MCKVMHLETVITCLQKGRHSNFMWVTHSGYCGCLHTIILCLFLVVENEVMLLIEFYHNKSAIATKGLCHFLVIEALATGNVQ